MRAAGRVGGTKKDEPRELRRDRIEMYRKMRGAGADRKRAYSATAPLDDKWSKSIVTRLKGANAEGIGPKITNIRRVRVGNRYEVTYDRDGLSHVFRTRGVSRAIGPSERPLPRDWGQHRRY